MTDITTTINRTLHALVRWLDAPEAAPYWERAGIEDHEHQVSPVAVNLGARPLR